VFTRRTNFLLSTLGSFACHSRAVLGAVSASQKPRTAIAHASPRRLPSILLPPAGITPTQIVISHGQLTDSPEDGFTKHCGADRLERHESGDGDIYLRQTIKQNHAQRPIIEGMRVPAGDIA
jgi:hypothetical protein